MIKNKTQKYNITINNYGSAANLKEKILTVTL